ncbi:hypothetical protein [Methylocaldum szegediense]|uniref:hypothetical protein n=1 Tax=Methylocaldum szegediense TaxID=73780 RepID=UPI000478FF60|nr:hypothetical protein [Methylocaldum szegediense]
MTEASASGLSPLDHAASGIVAGVLQLLEASEWTACNAVKCGDSEATGVPDFTLLKYTRD